MESYELVELAQDAFSYRVLGEDDFDHLEEDSLVIKIGKRIVILRLDEDESVIEFSTAIMLDDLEPFGLFREAVAKFNYENARDTIKFGDPPALLLVRKMPAYGVDSNELGSTMNEFLSSIGEFEFELNEYFSSKYLADKHAPEA